MTRRLGLLIFALLICGIVVVGWRMWTHAELTELSGEIQRKAFGTVEATTQDLLYAGGNSTFGGWGYFWLYRIPEERGARLMKRGCIRPTMVASPDNAELPHAPKRVPGCIVWQEKTEGSYEYIAVAQNALEISDFGER